MLYVCVFARHVWYLCVWCVCAHVCVRARVYVCVHLCVYVMCSSIPPAGADAEAAWRRAGRGWPVPEPSAADLRQRARAQLYDSMSGSPAKLAAALMPCGRRSYPDYSVTGTLYEEYDRPCAASNCPKQLFAPRDACGWTNVFGADCPVESSDEERVCVYL